MENNLVVQSNDLILATYTMQKTDKELMLACISQIDSRPDAPNVTQDTEYKVTVDEAKNSKLVRKSIVAKIKIKKGEKFSRKNITTKRPDNGISASKWFEVLNKVAKKDFNINELIKL